MRRIHRNVATCLAAAGSALFLLGCPIEPTKEPEEVEVVFDEEGPGAGGGSDVVVEIVSFGFMDTSSAGPAPLAADKGPGAAGESTAAEAAMAGDTAEEGEIDEEDEMGPRSGEVLFELLVRYTGTGTAPEGVDVDLVHKDDQDNEKGRYPYFAVSDGLAPGASQADFTQFEVPSWEEGDAFTVELRP